MHKDEIHELLSSYIDGDLSQRQETEVKRLLSKDEHIAEELACLKKQKMLLGALPKQTAPEEMIHHVKAALERKLLLSEYHHQGSEQVGAKHLFFRKVVSAAAMLVLVGLMSIVVYRIISPPGNESVNFADKSDRPSYYEQTLQDLDYENKLTAVASYPTILEATMVLETTDPISINAFLEKSIYTNGLVECTLPKREPKVSLYTITCEISQIRDMVADLGAVWHLFNQTQFTIHGEHANSNYTYNEFDPEMVMAFLKDYDGSRPIDYAVEFQHSYELNREITSNQVALSPTETNSELVPFKPFMTAPETVPNPLKKNKKDAQINLTIMILAL